MAIFSWSQQYATGIDKIDSQHKRLFEIINQLFDNMNSRVDRKVLRPILQGLVDYTKQHFAFEEQMLAAANYPQLTQHKKKHVELIAELKDFVNAYNKGDTMKLIKLSTFLKDWLCNHIIDTDLLYTDCVNKSGVAQ